MAVSDNLTTLESELSSAMGGSTTVSNPTENASDPLVQLALAHAVSVDELETRFNRILIERNFATAPEEELEQLASWIGESLRTVSRFTRVRVAFSGDNGLTVSSAQMTDNKGTAWNLESPVTIVNGIGFGVAVSPNGFYPVTPHELTLNLEIEGVSSFSNYEILEEGYLSESLSQFRKRLLSKEPVAGSDADLITSLSEISDGAKFVGSLPSCVGDGVAISVKGGNDQQIAQLIRNLSPFNYLQLKGNTTVEIDCEPVRFLRPCPVGVEIQYWATTEVDDDVFKQVLCESQELNLATFVSKISCINGLQVRLTPSHSQEVAQGCSLPETGIGCGDQEVSLISTDCPCNVVTCSTPTFGNCTPLEDWQYPVFVSATYMGVNC